MDFLLNLIPNDKTDSLNMYILDPLSVIIKLAILSNKPIGTKLCIQNNVIYFQDPGNFQPLCRMFYNANKTDLNFLNNPIKLACDFFLTEAIIKKHPKIVQLFTTAQSGLLRLIDTYKQSSIMKIFLHHYSMLISNYLNNLSLDELFKQDNMTALYTVQIIEKLNSKWTSEKINIVLDLTDYLLTDENASSDVKSLETIMDNIDVEIHTMLKFS